MACFSRLVPAPSAFKSLSRAMPSHRQRAARNGRMVSFAFVPLGYTVPLFRIERRVFPSTTVKGIVDSLKQDEVLAPFWTAIDAFNTCIDKSVPIDGAIPQEACCTIQVVVEAQEHFGPGGESETEAPLTEAPEPEAEESASDDEQVDLSALQ